MWHQVGFLADAFAVFKDHGLSIDLVSTSETSVTVTLDPAVNALDAARRAAARHRPVDGSAASKSSVPAPRSVSSAATSAPCMHRLGDALELFEEQKIYLVTQAANDLNLTFVVDEEQGDRLVRRLHDLTVRHVPADRVLGPTWEQIHGQGSVGAPAQAAVVAVRGAPSSSRSQARATAPMSTSERRLRAAPQSSGRSGASIGCCMRSRPIRTPRSSRAFAAQGLGFECVSRGEVERVLAAVPGIDRERILFTPELRAARRVRLGARHRDPGHARQPASAASLGRALSRPRAPGAHRHGLRTRSPRPRAHRGRALEVRCAAVRARRARAPDRGARCAHRRPPRPHRQRRVRRPQLAGSRPAARRSDRRASRDARIVNLGGGLGVPEKPGQAPVDLAALQAVIDELRDALAAAQAVARARSLSGGAGRRARGRR